MTDFTNLFSNCNSSGLVAPANPTDGCTDDISARIAAQTPNPEPPINPLEAAFLEAKRYLQNDELKKALTHTDLPYTEDENLSVLIALRHNISKPDARKIVEKAKSTLAVERSSETGKVL
jgi:hypothetical protein